MSEDNKEKNPVDDYRQFIKGLELKNVTLERLDTIRLLEPKEGVLRYSLSNDSIVKRYEGTTLDISAGFKVIATNNQNEDSDNNGPHLFEIEIIFIINYTNRSCIMLPDKDLERFLNTNVPLNVWPYARELISSITTRMGYPPLLIVPYKVY